MTVRGDGQGPAGVSAMQALYKTINPETEEPYIPTPTVPALVEFLTKPATDAAAAIGNTVAEAEATVSGLVADVGTAVAGANGVIAAGAQTLQARDQAAASAVSAQSAVAAAPLGTLRPGPFGSMFVLASDKDGSVLGQFEYDRPTGKIRLADHTLATDVDRTVAAATAAQVSAALAPAAPSDFAVLVAPDGSIIGRMKWHRSALTGQWDGHAMSIDVASEIASATADQTLTIQEPGAAGEFLKLVSSDGTVLARGLWDRTASVVRWDRHVLDTDPVALLDGQVIETKLARAVARVAMPHAGDYVDVEPGEWRSAEGNPTARSSASGYGWTRFPPDRSPYLRGVNDTGTAIQMRASPGLKIAGLKYISTYDPGAVASLTDRGTFTNSLPDPAGYLAGEYLEALLTAPTVVGGATYAQGDLAVLSGGAWVKQACPASAADEGDFFQAASSGTFKGIVLAAGDRIIHLGSQAVAGSGRRIWTKGRPDEGEVFLRGETATPSTTPPASPVDGDLWQVTAADGSYAVDDYLLRQGAAWLRVPTGGVAAYADGAGIWRSCTRGAQDWEFRRSDKSTTRVGLALRSRVTRKLARPTSGDLFMIGDSMPGFLSPSLTPALPDRSLVTESYSGRTAQQILTMFIDMVRNRGDLYGGHVLISWLGQNNAGDARQTNFVNAMLIAMMGSRDCRAILMSVLGQYFMGFSGGRITVPNHEGQLTRDPSLNLMVRTVLFLEEQFPDFAFDTRAELCIDAPTTPAILHPGMTEAQVAAAYGIVPYSYFFNYAAVAWTPGSLNFLGYRSAAGLPTGGSDLDYWIRSVADGGLDHEIGSFYVRVGGTWTWYGLGSTYVTHMVHQLGNQKLAARIVNRLTQRGW